MTPTRFLPVVLVLAGLLAGACSRGNELGPKEAVEILVIDGVDRAQAECMVSDLAEKIPLEKVTGIDTDLSDQEIAELAASSAACQPPIAGGEGVVGGDEPPGQLEGDLVPDRTQLMADLLRGGMDPDTASCLADATLAAPDPVAALADEQYRANALLECEANPEPG